MTIRYLSLVAGLLISSCDDTRHSHNSEKNNSERPNSSIDAGSNDTSQIRSIVAVDKFYEMKRPIFLELSNSKTPEAFLVAFNKVKKMHPDEQSFKVGCIFFYQFDNMMSGLENGFKPPFMDWMRLMGNDLGQIIDRLLGLPDEAKYNEVLVIFGAKFGHTFDEGLTRESARGILEGIRRKLKIFEQPH
jgi:hypothetical protein